MEQRQRERIELTEMDLIEALLAAQVGTDLESSGAMTAQDIAEQARMNVFVVRKRLRILEQAQRLEVTKVRRRRIDGMMALVPAYRLRAG